MLANFEELLFNQDVIYWKRFKANIDFFEKQNLAAFYGNVSSSSVLVYYIFFFLRK